jgi:hypothetical protein
VPVDAAAVAVHALGAEAFVLANAGTVAVHELGAAAFVPANAGTVAVHALGAEAFVLADAATAIVHASGELGGHRRPWKNDGCCDDFATRYAFGPAAVHEISDVTLVGQLECSELSTAMSYVTPVTIPAPPGCRCHKPRDKK